MALPRLPISFRLFSPQRKKARSFAPMLWSTLPTQFQNMSLLKCSGHSRFVCHGATPAVEPLGSGQYCMIDRAVGLMRSAGILLPGNGSRDPVAARVSPPGRRIVDDDLAALGIHDTAEVAVPHRQRRHRAGQRGGRAFPVLLAGEQEERLVLEDRAIDAEPVLIDVLIGLRSARRVEDERVGGQGLAPHVVVDFAVEAVGARLQRHVDDAAGGAAVLRVVRVRGDFHLLDGGRRRHVGDVVAALVGVVRCAVEQELVVAALAAVHRPGGERAVVERTEVDRLGVVVDAGDERDERHRAARLQRNLRDAGAVDDGAAVGVAGLEQRRVRADVDVLGQADTQLDVDRRGLARLARRMPVRVYFWNPDSSTVRLYRARPQERNGVVAFGVGRRRGCFVRVRVLHGHSRARQCALARIEDLSSHRGAEFLRGDATGRDQQRRKCEQARIRSRSHPHQLPPR